MNLFQKNFKELPSGDDASKSKPKKKSNSDADII